MAVWLSGQWRSTYLPPFMLASPVLAVVSFATMYIPGTNAYVSWIIGGYTVLIAFVDASGILLVAAYGWRNAAPGIWAVAAGLILAPVADAVIGSFWIYGNEGRGFFPLVSDLNWILYIGSQCLVLHPPRVTVRALDR